MVVGEKPKVTLKHSVPNKPLCNVVIGVLTGPRHTVDFMVLQQPAKPVVGSLYPSGLNVELNNEQSPLPLPN